MNKQAVAQAFSDAAVHYDSVAHLQRTVADQLMSIVLNLSIGDDSRVVDLGTGTGYLLPTLARRFNPYQLLALDLSEQMLQQASQREPSAEIVLADLENPPFELISLDLAVSSLAVQWLTRPVTFLTNMYQQLKPGGYLAIATLGPSSLIELKQAWQRVDNIKHVNEFNRSEEWFRSIAETNFETIQWQEEYIEVNYESPLTLLSELKLLGASYVDRQTQPQVSSVRKMLRAYQEFQQPNKQYPATWEVYYAILRKP